MVSIDDLVTATAAENTAVDSMIAFLDGIEKQLADALSGATLPPAVQTKVDAVFAAATAKAAAITTAINTPGA